MWKMFIELYGLANNVAPWFFDGWSYWFNCGPLDGMIGLIL